MAASGENNRATSEALAGSDRYRRFFDAPDAARLVIDPASGRILEANPAAAALYGRAPEALCAMGFRDIEADAEEEGAPLARTFPAREDEPARASQRAAESGPVLARHRASDGGSRDVEIYSGAAVLGGREVLVLTIHDVTERLKRERLKSDAERIVLHDLKNALIGMVSVPSLLLEDANLTAEQRELIAILGASAKRTMLGVSTSMEMLKIESGEYRLRPVECFPLIIVLNCIDILSKGLHFDTDRIAVAEQLHDPKGERKILRTDAMLVESIVMNLLKNAVEASGQGNKVFVRVTEMPGGVELVIRNARPVPQEMRERFFEKYATSGKQGGTGLGTYSAAAMTRAIGGEIRMESSDGKGTTVTLFIPDALHQ